MSVIVIILVPDEVRERKNEDQGFGDSSHAEAVPFRTGLDLGQSGNILDS